MAASIRRLYTSRISSSTGRNALEGVLNTDRPASSPCVRYGRVNIYRLGSWEGEPVIGGSYEGRSGGEKMHGVRRSRQTVRCEVATSLVKTRSWPLPLRYFRNWGAERARGTSPVTNKVVCGLFLICAAETRIEMGEGTQPVFSNYTRESLRNVAFHTILRSHRALVCS